MELPAVGPGSPAARTEPTRRRRPSPGRHPVARSLAVRASGRGRRRVVGAHGVRPRPRRFRPPQAQPGTAPGSTAESAARSALRSAAASPATPTRFRPAPGTSVTDAPGSSAASGTSTSGSSPRVAWLATGPGAVRPVGPARVRLDAGGQRLVGGEVAVVVDAIDAVGRSRPGRPGGAAAPVAAAAARGRDGGGGLRGPVGLDPPGRGSAGRTDLGPRVATTSVGSVIGSSVTHWSRRPPPASPYGPDRSVWEGSRSNSQGRRSASVLSVSSREPRATSSSSPANMAGSNSSSWATQSASSSRQVGATTLIGVVVARVPGEHRRHLAGWGLGPVGQFGRGGRTAGHRRLPGRTGSTARPASPGLAGLVDQMDRGLVEEALLGRGTRQSPTRLGGSASVSPHRGSLDHRELPGDLAGRLGPHDPDPVGARVRWRRRRVRGASREGRSGSRHPLPLGRRPRQLVPSIHRTAQGRPGFRSRGAPALCEREVGRWRPRGPG